MRKVQGMNTGPTDYTQAMVDTLNYRGRIITDARLFRDSRR